jgi:hypothetical protein
MSKLVLVTSLSVHSLFASVACDVGLVFFVVLALTTTTVSFSSPLIPLVVAKKHRCLHNVLWILLPICKEVMSADISCKKVIHTL